MERIPAYCDSHKAEESAQVVPMSAQALDPQARGEEA